jgi:bifunctional ADP-heptose synthase (sugar kinase/adenylyltransferase)
MRAGRFWEIVGHYKKLSIAVVGDFCLDRYLEIDPKREEVSLETGLPVQNVVNVRAQPGGAGTVLNNLAALGIGKIFPVGFCGDDGEGYELRRALGARSGVQLDHFFQTNERRTFTYCKPLIIKSGKPPRELNRLDQKNWTATTRAVVERLRASVLALAKRVDAIALLSQVDRPETGVVTSAVLKTIGEIAKRQPRKVIIADSRRGLTGFPRVIFKMNAVELARLTANSEVRGQRSEVRSQKLGIRGSRFPGADCHELSEISQGAIFLANRNQRPVFVTLAERGIIGASPKGEVEHMPALPVHSEIDIVGAGDAVMANLTAGLAAGAGLREALELANAAASIVIHQLGTTGVARISDLQKLVCC